MTKKGATSENVSLRLGVPELFSAARFEQVLIFTFGADLEFYEKVLRRSFGWFRNQIVLGDGHLLQETINTYAASGALRHMNRSWLAAPISGQHAAHAKIILLAGPEDGLLLVGSGNMNMGGYARQGECFVPYRWSGNQQDEIDAFTTIRDLSDGLCSRGLLDSLTQDRLRVFWAAYDWWNETPTSTGSVRHNLETPLGEQLVAAVAGEKVRELTVISPFHDRKCAALGRLIKELKPESVRVLVQRDHCSVDPSQLAKVLRPPGGTVHSVRATGDDNAYLHAKVVHVATPARSICLTGSANCSMVALWTRHPDANLEVGNLTIGAADSFSALFDPAVVTISKAVSPSTLNVSLQQDPADEDGAAAPVLSIRSLAWSSPLLTAELSASISDPADLEIVLDGRQLSGTVGLSPTEDGWTAVHVKVPDQVDQVAIDDVAVLTFQLNGIGDVSGVPYQPDRLREQDRRRVDVDRLRQATRFEIDDPDLHRALVALEGILIGDSVTEWARGRQSTDQPPVDTGEFVAWDDIDWAAVRRSSRHAAYGGAGGFGTTGSDLAIYLDALSKATRDLIDPPSTSEGERPEAETSSDDEESDVEGGIEGTDPDDIEETGDVVRRQSAAARNRRILRNFVRRNLNALEHPSFRDGAGPGVVVLNMIILNWLCWWIATSDEDHPGDLIDERLRLWALMWGDGHSDGYFSSLPDEYQALAIERFDEQHFESVTLASIYDAWAGIEYETDPEFGRLRSMLRCAVVHPCWQVTPLHAQEAVRLINGRPTTNTLEDSDGVAEVIWDSICKPIGDTELREAISRAAHVPPTSVSFSHPEVIVEPSTRRAVKEATLSGGYLTETSVANVFAAWIATEELPFYRLRWDGGVALYGDDRANCWVYDDETDKKDFLEEIDPHFTPSAEWVHWFVSEVAESSPRAA